MMQEMDEEFWSNVQNNLNSTNFWKGQLCAFRYDKSEREYDNRQGLLYRWKENSILPMTTGGRILNSNNATYTHSIFVKL